MQLSSGRKAPVVVDYWYTSTLRTARPHARWETYVRWILVMLGRQTDRCYKLAQCKCSFDRLPLHQPHQLPTILLLATCSDTSILSCICMHGSSLFILILYYYYRTVPNKQAGWIHTVLAVPSEPATTQWRRNWSDVQPFSGVTNCLARPCVAQVRAHVCPPTTYYY